MRGFLELIVTVAVAVLIAFLVQAFLIKPYRIPSGSMEPALSIDQRILVNRLDTHPKVGSIVVFHPPASADAMTCADPRQGPGDAAPCDKVDTESGETFVKRVVGVGGDRLTIRDGLVTRNGTPEHGHRLEPCGGVSECSFSQTITVPRGDYYMMGDNRGNSDDSRYWGPIPQRWIIGTAVATYWPPDRIGIF